VDKKNQLLNRAGSQKPAGNSKDYKKPTTVDYADNPY